VVAAAPLCLAGCADQPGAATAAASRPAAGAQRFAALRRPAPRPAAAPALTTSAGIARARRFVATRRGTVGFAVLDERGRLRGRHRTATLPSASVSKAMLLVAVLRRAGHRPLSSAERALLEPMITASDNDAADAVYRSVGATGLIAVARAAGCRRFADVGHWANAQLTAADQARLFLRIDRLVPRAHRAYLRRLLRSIVSAQRWGIAPVAARHHMRISFKGGWRPGLVHQVALLERGGRRIALAILTSGQPSHAYGEATVRGIASRVLS